MKTVKYASSSEPSVANLETVILIDDSNADKYLPVVVDESDSRANKYRFILRRAAVTRLRASGLNYVEIVERLKDDEMVAPLLPENYSIKDAKTDVQIYLDYLRQELNESIVDIVALENQRFDTALAAIWDRVKAGDIKAIETMLKISERRSKLLGLDAAIQIDWRIELVQMLEQGYVDVKQVQAELGDELYAQFVQFAEETYDQKFGEQSKDVHGHYDAAALEMFG